MLNKKRVFISVFFLLIASIIFAEPVSKIIETNNIDIPLEDGDRNLISYTNKVGAIAANNSYAGWTWSFNSGQYMSVSVTPQETDGRLSLYIYKPDGSVARSEFEYYGKTVNINYKCTVSGTFKVRVYNLSTTNVVNYALHWVKMDSEADCFKAGITITQNMRDEHSSDYIARIYEYLKFTSELFKTDSNNKLPCVFTIDNIDRVSSYSSSLTPGYGQDLAIQFDWNPDASAGGKYARDDNRVDMFFTREFYSSKTSYFSRNTALLAHELGHYRNATELYNSRDNYDYENHNFIMANPHSIGKTAANMYFNPTFALF